MKLSRKSISSSAVAVAMTFVAGAAQAADVTFQLSNGAEQATPSGQNLAIHTYQVYMNGSDKKCYIGWNKNECTILNVKGSGYTGMGHAPQLVEVSWHNSRYPNQRNVIGKTSFWMKQPAADSVVNIPVANVTFRTDDNPFNVGRGNNDRIQYYLMSSSEVSTYGPLSQPSSINRANETAHRIGDLTWGSREATLPVLAGCYTVSFLMKNDYVSGNTAQYGGLEESKVLCVGEDDTATVDFALSPRSLTISQDAYFDIPQ